MSATRVKPTADEIAAQRKAKAVAILSYQRPHHHVVEDIQFSHIRSFSSLSVSLSNIIRRIKQTDINVLLCMLCYLARKDAAAKKPPTATSANSSSQKKEGKKDKNTTTPTININATNNNTTTNVHNPHQQQQPAALIISTPSSVTSASRTQRLSHMTSNSTSSISTAAPSSSTPTISSSASSSSSSSSSARPLVQYDNLKKKKKYEKQSMLVRRDVEKHVPLFSHLPQYQRESSLSAQVGFISSDLPAPIYHVGLQYANGTISGSNARCIAMLTAFHQVIANYQIQHNKVLRDDLLQSMKPWVRFLSDCRPHSISMGNAIRFLKLRISQLSPMIDMNEAKLSLCNDIMQFIQIRITVADEAIIAAGVARINNNDVILTYTTSHVVESILLTAHSEGKRFSVIIVDSRPKLEGERLLHRLIAAGLTVTYLLITAVSYVMKRVSIVLLGAYSMLSNGSCISRVGSAIIAMMAHTYCIPVLICCETYKFTDRVQLDAICSNELADPIDLQQLPQNHNNQHNHDKNHKVMDEFAEKKHLKLLNLVYDLTPVEFVTMVITEVGNVPPTSVPVILREYHNDSGDPGGADFD